MCSIMRQRNQNSQKLYRNERNYEAIITQNDLKLYRNVRNCEWTQTQNHRNRAECPQNQDQIIPKTDAKKTAFKRDKG